MIPECRANYLDLIAQCEALPDDEEAQALREGLLKSLEPPPPPDPIADRNNELMAAYAWTVIEEDAVAIHVAVANIQQWFPEPQCAPRTHVPRMKFVGGVTRK
jgi:hypothetical protein